MFRKGNGQPITQPRRLTFRQLREIADEELMIHLQNGNDDALAVLFDRFHRLVLAIAAKIVRDPGEAEDVMQTVFLDIYRAKAQFDASKGSTKVWLLQYAYHRSINRRRQLSSRKFFDHVSFEEFGSDGLRIAGLDPVAKSPQESSVLVREALATLNNAQKTALELAYFDGLTMQEIAERTSQTVANVRHHFYRGLDKLRSCLKVATKKVEVPQ